MPKKRVKKSIKTIVSCDGNKVSYLVSRPEKKPDKKDKKSKKGKEKTFVVFLHGWMSSKSYFKKYFTLLEKKNIPFIAIDLRGHGGSDAPADKDKYELYLMAKDVLYVMEAEKVNKATLFAHSMGGMIALEFYDMWPEKVKSLILCNTSFRGPNPKDIKWRLVNKKITKMFRAAMKKERFVNQVEQEFGFEKSVKARSMIYLGMKILEFNNSDVLKKINAPVLIIAAEKDEYFSETVTLQMNSKIKDSKLLFFDTNHDTIRLRYKEVSKEVLDFLQSGPRRHTFLVKFRKGE